MLKPQISHRHKLITVQTPKGVMRRPSLSQEEYHPLRSNPTPPAHDRKFALRQGNGGLPQTEHHYPTFDIQARRFNGVTGHFNLPRIPDIYYFNPTLCDHMGSRWVTFRRSFFDYGHWKNYRTTISMFPVEQSTMKLGREYELAWPKRDPMEQTDDPRTVMINGHLTLGVCSWRTPQDKAPTIVHQSLGVFDQMQIGGIVDVAYRGNGTTIFNGTAMEKNWLWFEHDGAIHFVYQAEPMTVCRVENGKVAQEYVTNTDLKWNRGTVRGGTPPVRVGDLYYTFFHSSIPWRHIPPVGVRNRYYMGCLAFDAFPPFKVRKITKDYMLGGTFNEPTIKLAPPCVFPSGALLDDGRWTITYGINDCTGGWLKVDHAEVEKLLTELPNEHMLPNQ